MKLEDAIAKLLIRDMKRIDGITKIEGLPVDEFEFKMYKIPHQNIIRIDLKENKK